MKSTKVKNVLAPGFRFSGLNCGIKSKGQKDLAVISSDVPAKAVGLFTTNQVKAAPIVQGQEVLKNGRLQAVVINSGIANVATGRRGIQDAYRTAKQAAKLLRTKENQVLVSSTGKVGGPLPLQKILAHLPLAIHNLSYKNLSQTAEAIMTTDRFAKVHQVKAKIGKKNFHVTGIAKGAGMIEPNMATMLAYILTDLDLQSSPMKKIFKRAVNASFNSITVDGDMSTNDTALLLANGLSGIPILKSQSPGLKKFEQALSEVCQALALMMVQDGEGATKVVEIKVKGAKNNAAARKMANAIARSQLVKTSFFGEDPNWGRILVALGYSGETFNPLKVDIFYGSIALARNGQATNLANEKKAALLMRAPSFSITIEVKQGRGEARVWSSDLGYEYIRINAEYRT